MKKFTILALVIVLTAGVMAGCRRGSGEITTGPMETEEMTIPSVMPTVNMPTDDTGATEETSLPGDDTSRQGMLN